MTQQTSLETSAELFEKALLEKQAYRRKYYEDFYKRYSKEDPNSFPIDFSAPEVHVKDGKLPFRRFGTDAKYSCKAVKRAVDVLIKDLEENYKENIESDGEGYDESDIEENDESDSEGYVESDSKGNVEFDSEGNFEFNSEGYVESDRKGYVESFSSLLKSQEKDLVSSKHSFSVSEEKFSGSLFPRSKFQLSSIGLDTNKQNNEGFKPESLFPQSKFQLSSIGLDSKKQSNEGFNSGSLFPPDKFELSSIGLDANKQSNEIFNLGSLFLPAKFQLSSIGLDSNKKSDEEFNELSNYSSFDLKIKPKLHISQQTKYFRFNKRSIGSVGKIHKVKKSSTILHRPIKNVVNYLKSIYSVEPFSLKSLGLDTSYEKSI